jgi:phage shock protein A
MLANKINIINEFEKRLRFLIAKYTVLKEDKQTLTKDKKKLEEQIKVLTEKHKELEDKYNTLKLAKNITSTEADNVEVKKKINTLVREIDKCITLMNQ